MPGWLRWGGNETNLHVFETVLLSDAAQHILLAALLHLASEKELVKDEVRLLEVEDDVQLAHVAVVLVHLLDKAMHNLQRDQLVVRRVDACDEVERGVAAIHDLGVCGSQRLGRHAHRHSEMENEAPLYSMKLHMRVRRASTSCETSFTILALSFGDSVVNHLARRCTQRRKAVRTTGVPKRNRGYADSQLCPAATAGSSI